MRQPEPAKKGMTITRRIASSAHGGLSRPSVYLRVLGESNKLVPSKRHRPYNAEIKHHLSRMHGTRSAWNWGIFLILEYLSLHNEMC